LQEYGGALILVSHDRHLLNNTVDQFLIIRGGKVEFFDGSLEDYEKLVLEGGAKKAEAAPKASNAVAEAQGVVKKEQRQQSAQAREQLKPLKDKIKKLEQQLEKDSAQLAALEQQLTDVELYSDANKAKLAKLVQQQGELKRKVSDTEEQWLLATTELEGIG
jgi:ATP-binding cassette subfamily F protein 3